ncbi:hypothetical protein E2542_SST01652 [Spatholobus suberectus]|nr:hypothetical protein E2542_SST01652 [Spatholobus suberectus]
MDTKATLSGLQDEASSTKSIGKRENNNTCLEEGEKKLYKEMMMGNKLEKERSNWDSEEDDFYPNSHKDDSLSKERESEDIKREPEGELENEPEDITERHTIVNYRPINPEVSANTCAKVAEVVMMETSSEAFNYLSFGLLTALNNLWTWVALLTAALSFWKIRSAGCPKPKPEAQPSIGPDPVTDTLAPTDVTVEKTEPRRQPAVGNGVTEDVDGVRKGKFTVYYEEDTKCTCGERKGFSTAWQEERERSEETEWWERLLRLRNGESENGWYTWQDLTELNGNVVRLWDGGLSGSTTFVRESWYNSSCIHVWSPSDSKLFDKVETPWKMGAYLQKDSNAQVQGRFSSNGIGDRGLLPMPILPHFHPLLDSLVWDPRALKSNILLPYCSNMVTLLQARM